MNKWEKLATQIVAVIGAGSGIWASYTAYDASKFKQPFDERDHMAASFNAQIASAESRKDRKEVLRVRTLYEQYEEGWRDMRRVAAIVAPIEALAAVKVSDPDAETLRAWLTANGDQTPARLPPKTLGAAYFAVGDYSSAAEQLQLASSRSDDPEAWALQSAAFGELAATATSGSQRAAYEDSAAASFSAALSARGAKVREINAFAAKTTTLSHFVTKKPSKTTQENQSR
jgi:hypothetical protein